MSRTDGVVTRAAPEKAPAPTPPAPRRRTGILVVLLILLCAADLRLYAIDEAFELFIDEVTYSDIAASVAAGDGLRLHGEAFHLHPPGLFLVLAGVITLLGLDTPDLAGLTFALRPVVAISGAIIPAAVAVVVRRATGSWPLAAAAGVLLALEPFLIRFDSRVLLEAQAMGFAALGMLGLTGLVLRQRQGRNDSRRGRHGAHQGVRGWPTVLVGLAMAGSILTKETYGSVAVLPVLVLLLTGRVLPRATTARVLATTVLAYSSYVLVLAATGQFGDWFGSKTRGVRRLLGLTQETGFNADAGSAGFVDRILANLANFGVTYALIGLSVAATLWLLVLLRRRTTLPGLDRPIVALLVIWSLCSQAHLAYAVTLGTLEEQMFYLLVVSAVPVLCVLARLLLEGTQETLPPGVRSVPVRARAVVLALALAAALLFDGVVWWRIHTVPDDAYARFLDWAREELPSGSRVVATDETTQFLLEDVRVFRLDTGGEAREFRAQYVIVLEELLEQGYSSADQDLRRIIAAGTVVFEAEGRTVGRLSVVDVADVVEQG